MKMLLMQPAAGGESCGAGFFFISEEIQRQRVKDSFAFLTNQRFYFRMKAAVFAKTNT